MRKNIIALMALMLVVVALSGCIGETVGKGTATGVIIKSFGPDISEVFSGDPVVFTATVENVGGEDATNVRAKLYGLGTDWTGSDWVTVANRVKTIGFLERSQPEFDVPGGLGDAQWTELYAPDGLKVDNTYSAGARIYYGYKTTALANIRIYDNDYLRANPDEAQRVMKSSGVDSFTVTSAPITVELAGVARPLVYRAGVTQLATITFLIDNAGQGKPYKTEENDMTVTVETVRINNQACEGAGQGAGDYRLPREGKKSVPCTFTLPDVDTYTTVPAEIVVSYTYFIDTTSSIKVLKGIYTGGVGPTATTGPTLPTP